MKEEIINLLDRYGDTAITAVKNKIKNANGEHTYGLFNKDGSEMNVFLADEVSENFIQTIQELFDEGIIRMKVCNFLIHSFDGGDLYSEKIAKPNKTYKSLRWLPITIELNEKN